MNSPADVVQFFQQLMHTPENAIEIINKFMNNSAEAMQILPELSYEKLIAITQIDSTTKLDGNERSIFNIPSKQNTQNISSSMVRNLLDSTIDVTHNTSSKDRTTSPNCDQFKSESNISHQNQSITLESIISDAIKMEYNWTGNKTHTNRQLNDSETAKLNELIVAYKDLFIPLDEDITPLVKDRNDPTKKVRKFGS